MTTPTTATASRTYEAGKAVLDLARTMTFKMVDDIPPEKLCTTSVAGTNHALWVLGHLACTDNWFACEVGKRESVIDESWSALLGMQSTPVGDASAYPSVDEIKTGMHRARESLLAAFQSMDQQQLQGPLPDELKGFAPNLGGAMLSLAWHEGFHAGQLSAVRRSLGLPNAMGM